MILVLNELPKGAWTFGRLACHPANLVLRSVKQGFPSELIFNIIDDIRLVVRVFTLLENSGALEKGYFFLDDISLNHKSWSELFAFIRILLKVMLNNQRGIACKKLSYLFWNQAHSLVIDPLRLNKERLTLN